MKFRMYEQDGEQVIEVALPAPEGHELANECFDSEGRPLNLRAWRLPVDTSEADAKEYVSSALAAEEATEEDGQQSVEWADI